MQVETFHKYPMALYASADQRREPITVTSEAQEDEARKAGFKSLAEWWAETGVPDCEPDEFLSRVAQPAPTKAKK